LVGKRLLRVYAQPSGAATKRIGKDRSRPIKDDKRRGSGADRACKRWNIDVVNFPARPDAGHRAIRKTTAKKRRSGSACWRHMRSSWPGVVLPEDARLHSAPIEIAAAPILQR
jgi:hypothetical protein